MSSLARTRRLATDQAAVRNSPPLDYIFPSSLASDDLTSLDVYLIGPAATPYENGIWKIHLKMTQTYPNEPPTASFRTKIFHPNMAETTGEVCVDTLKNGWNSKLTLKDVLSTIRCLLIHPNPSSALNSEAGMLHDSDYKAFVRQAKLFTKIHASVPNDLKAVVKEARQRGEELVDAANNNKKKKEKTEKIEKKSTSATAPTESTNAEKNVLHTPTTENLPNAPKPSSKAAATVSSKEDDNKASSDSIKDSAGTDDNNSGKENAIKQSPSGRKTSAKRSFEEDVAAIVTASSAEAANLAQDKDYASPPSKKSPKTEGIDCVKGSSSTTSSGNSAVAEKVAAAAANISTTAQAPTAKQPKTAASKPVAKKPVIKKGLKRL